MRQVWKPLGAAIVAAVLVTGAEAATPEGSIATTPTHKQLRTIKPQHGDRDVTLWTYCLGEGGNLWVSVSTDPRYATLGLDGKLPGTRQAPFRGIQVYDPDGSLLAEHPLGFPASAIDFAPDGTLFVAGQGKLARLSASGEVLAEAPTPNIGDLEEFKKKVVEQTKAEYKKQAEQFEKQVEMLAKQIEPLEKKKEADRSAAEQARLEALRQQKQQFDQIVQVYTQQAVDPESTVLQRLTIPGLAATAEHVFVVVQSTSGRGYEVWRTNHELAEGKRVCDGLSGCCGNMDIQARDDGFVASENSRFQVVAYSPEGKQLSSFGKRDRSAPDGFGSCCNPMNSLSLSSGEYLVAESSIGNIKRFDADGKFLGIVGKARISGSCKHVALGFDEQRDRYYMMNQDKNHICVLVPLAEAPEVTEEERLALEAKAGLGKKLVGRWRVEGATDEPEKKPNRFVQLLTGRRNQQSADVEAEFLEDGSARLAGGNFASFSPDAFSWECVSQSEGVLQFALLLDGVELQTLHAKFNGDDKLQFDGSYYFPSGKTFVRQTGEPPAETAADE